MSNGSNIDQLVADWVLRRFNHANASWDNVSVTWIDVDPPRKGDDDPPEILADEIDQRVREGSAS